MLLVVGNPYGLYSQPSPVRLLFSASPSVSSSSLALFPPALSHSALFPRAPIPLAMLHMLPTPDATRLTAAAAAAAAASLHPPPST